MKLLERKTITVIVEFAVAWAVLFGLPFAIPALIWPINLEVSIGVTSIILILAVLYFGSDNKIAKTLLQEKSNPTLDVETTEAGTKISVTVQLPTARWGESNSVKVEVEQSNTVSDLVSKAMKQSGIPPDMGPLYVIAGQVILGPQDYSKPINTSGIQNNQTVMLTDKPPVEIVPSTLYRKERAYRTLKGVLDRKSVV